MSLKNFTRAALTGGPSANTFTVSDWTGAATLAGGGGTDRVVSTNDAGFTLSDSSLTRSTGGGSFALMSIAEAYLTTGSGDNTARAMIITFPRE